MLVKIKGLVTFHIPCCRWGFALPALRSQGLESKYWRVSTGRNSLLSGAAYQQAQLRLVRTSSYCFMLINYNSSA